MSSDRHLAAAELDTLVLRLLWSEFQGRDEQVRLNTPLVVCMGENPAQLDGVESLSGGDGAGDVVVRLTIGQGGSPTRMLVKRSSACLSRLTI